MIAASETYTFSEKKLLRIDQNGMLDTLLWGMQDRRIHSIWYDAHSGLYACGGGVFAWNGKRWKEFTEVPLIFTQRIRGNAENDIWVAGDFGILAHFNGMNWRVYPEAALNGIYYSLAVMGDQMMAVGEVSTGGNTTRAVILSGRR